MKTLLKSCSTSWSTNRNRGIKIIYVGGNKYFRSKNKFLEETLSRALKREK